jgi:hypothetical protein
MAHRVVALQEWVKTHRPPVTGETGTTSQGTR